MYDLYIMRRTQIYLDETQGERLAIAAQETGSTMSAVIRQAIDVFLDSEASEDARLERFRSAVVEASGSAPDLPVGSEYVESVRPDYAEREHALWGDEE